MIIGKKTQVAADFKPSINHILIEQTDNLRYLGVYLDNKLSWCSKLLNAGYRNNHARKN